MLGSFVYQMAKLTLEEKRRQNLKRQLYGKDSFQEPKTHVVDTNSNTIKTPTTLNERVENTENGDYLKRDLTKILIVSIAAIIIQFALFWALNHHLITLPGISL